MVQQDVSDGEQIILEKPERGAKDGYLGSFFVASQQMNRLIAESNGYSDPRIRLLTLAMISGITDDTIRAHAFKFFNDTINKINSTDKSVDEKNKEIADFCCGEMRGHVVSFYDQFVGISHRLKLGTI
jgi:hypothetical protein